MTTVWRRWLARVLMIVALVGAGAVLTAGPAAADICKDAPKPIYPKSGLPGMLTSTPKDIPDAAPDPFADAAVPIGDVYGYDWLWTNYDLGCGNDFLRDPIAVTNTQSANVIMAHLGAGLAGLDTLEHMAKSSSLDWLSTVIATVAGKLSLPILAVWLPLAVVAVGLIVGFRAKRSNYADSMRTLLIIAGAVTIAVFALLFPSTASRVADKAATSVAEAAGKQFSATASDAVTRESAYRTWLTGNFGNPDSEVARELGPQLLAATHYTWSDVKRMNADPNAQKQIDARKAAGFKKVAADLENRDPAAYETFTGRGERTGPAVMGVFTMALMSLFVGMATLMVLIARVMMQGLALAAPLAAIVGVLPTHTNVLSRLWDLFTAAVVAVAKFVIAGGIMVIVLGAISSSSTFGPGAKLFWMLVATVVGIVLTRPVRSFKTIIPGMDPNKSYLRTAVSGVAGYFGARIGAETGVGEAIRPANAETITSAHATADARESLDPLPRPTFVELSPAPATPVLAASSNIARALPAGSTQAWERDRSWPGVVPSAKVPAALPAAPLRLEAAKVATEAPAVAPTLGVIKLAAADRAEETPSFGPIAGTDDATSASPSATGSTRSAEVQRPRPPTSPMTGGSEVIYPTGVIAAPDESPLYRSDKVHSPAEVYIPREELDLAEDGSEHALITYHSGA